MTGDVVCTTSTSAGAIFQPTTVKYADNTKEDVSFDVLPYPVFEGGQRVAVQRGGGMCILKSNAEKERAAAIFLKWLIEPAQNIRFSAFAGYMPVTKEAFSLLLSDKLESVENELVSKTLRIIATMNRDYRFYIPPVFDGFDELQKKYVTKLITTAKNARREYINEDNQSQDEFNFEARMRDFVIDF
jgi:multiple sugar transport system substrate-binding protein